jgi:hypothetical protein
MVLIVFVEFGSTYEGKKETGFRRIENFSRKKSEELSSSKTFTQKSPKMVAL